jgi:hypothetical protein
VSTAINSSSKFDKNQHAGLCHVNGHQLLQLLTDAALAVVPRAMRLVSTAISLSNQ